MTCQPQSFVKPRIYMDKGRYVCHSHTSAFGQGQTMREAYLDWAQQQNMWERMHAHVTGQGYGGL